MRSCWYVNRCSRLNMYSLPVWAFSEGCGIACPAAPALLTPVVLVVLFSLSTLSVGCSESFDEFVDCSCCWKRDVVPFGPAACASKKDWRSWLQAWPNPQKEGAALKAPNGWSGPALSFGRLFLLHSWRMLASWGPGLGGSSSTPKRTSFLFSTILHGQLHHVFLVWLMDSRATWMRSALASSKGWSARGLTEVPGLLAHVQDVRFICKA